MHGLGCWMTWQVEVATHAANANRQAVALHGRASLKPVEGIERPAWAAW